MSLINSKNIFIGNDVIIEDSVLLNAEYGKGIYIEDNVTIKKDLQQSHHLGMDFQEVM